MIGQEITYSSNGQSEWIIFGKDSAGNILITTKAPIDDGFTLNYNAESWLNYEDKLNGACSKYVTQIQGRNDITARSITLNDINYVTGFKKPNLNSYRYTFGETSSEENGVVDYFYPSKEVSGYWQDPKDKLWTPLEDLDIYAYRYDYVDGQFIYSGPDNDFYGVPITDENLKPENFKYVLGENYESGTYINDYLVASRSVEVSFGYAAYFQAASVHTNVVGYDGCYALCESDSEGGKSISGNNSLAIRPIVVLPSDIKVEETSSGVYDLAK